MKKILIIGAGWLGIPLAIALKNKRNLVFCLYRTEKTKQKIQFNELHAVSSCETNWQEFDVVILCFPPGVDKLKYADEIREYGAKLNAKTHLIFTSSTGIYPAISETFTENSHFEVPQNKFHIKQAENIVLEHENSTVLRLGGLFGKDRHPVTFLSGRPLKNPKSPINLVHQEDVIRVVIACIEKNWKGILNVVAPSNATRFEFYTRSAKEQNLPSPIPIESETINRKIISQRLIEDFGFLFLNC